MVAAGEESLPALTPAAQPMLEGVGLSCGYNGVVVLRSVDIAIHPGELVAILGRNGCGKSTLLRCLSGTLPPLEGTITLAGVPLARQERRQVARTMAVVAQELAVPFAFTVREVVELGRAPYARFMGLPDAADRAAVATALAVTDLEELAGRIFQQISGGEQQRVALALALAQQPRMLLLDEPTVHLDIVHQMALLSLIRRLCREQGLAVAAAMHDINLTSLFFDKMLVLGRGSVVAAGTPEAVITPAVIEHAFGTRVVVTTHPTLPVPQVSLVP